MATRNTIRTRRPAPPSKKPAGAAAGTRRPYAGSAALIERLSALFPPGQGCDAACVYCRGGSGLQGVFTSAKIDPSGPAGPVAVLGAAEDPYSTQQLRQAVTRSNLEALRELGSPLVIVTRSPQILRDLDILSVLAREGRLRVFVALGTLDAQASHRLEPDADDPQARIDTIRAMARAGLHAGVLLTPVIPGLTSTDVEAVLEAAAAAGAGYADIAVFALPPRAGELFAQWLKHQFPHRSNVLLGLMQALGQQVSSPSGSPRPAAETPDYLNRIAARFDLACRRFLLEPVASPRCCGRFRVPGADG